MGFKTVSMLLSFLGYNKGNHMCLSQANMHLNRVNANKKAQMEAGESFFEEKRRLDKKIVRRISLKASPILTPPTY
jgi:hypothetical protein